MSPITRHGYSDYQRPSGNAYRKARGLVLAAARLHGARCHFCNGAETTADPFEAHHIQRIVDGGAVADPANMAPAHRSCNRRGGPPRGWR
jgi:hypothetical protein